jgi:hypothetical protein
MTSPTEKFTMYRSTNPGDRIQPNQTLEEKAKQLAVDAPDITGDHIKVPTYFIVQHPNGQKQALHHVKDAKKISDVIRQMQLYEENRYTQSERDAHFFNWSGIVLVVALFVLTIPILIGIF